ncbi:L10-interacting MYB domain-containing protein-like [Magnolia sinica]|uniref:L10-interacting MYB domain-containing protein-like n=1 Tax=Magnolia sinica TaxID=86752 RepID=UPI00265B4FC1|nr:L10-interacting MYB domain-containing protein-like [Magnolia sinica]
MDQILFDTFIEQVTLGHKADNSFKREAYQIATEEVTKHTDVAVRWQNVSNRLRYYKREYNVVKDILGASGFGWDNERLVVTAPDEVWDQYLRSHPRAERLRGKRIERMDDLAVICGSD